MAVEGDWEEMERNELDYAKKTSRVIWGYMRLLQIRCQDTASEDWNPSACVMVNWKVCK
jgi:hypothetical protein